MFACYDFPLTDHHRPAFMTASWPAAFDAFRTVHPAETLEELSVVSARENGRNFMLHLSRNKNIKAMVPYVTTRTQAHEDRSIPRICVAPAIADCLIGYNGTVDEFQNREQAKSGDGSKTIPWTGGWYIYAIPFEYALKPSENLLVDADKTNEHWLVSYSPQTWSYAPIRIGKLFYTQVGYQAGRGGHATVVEMYIELDSPVRVPFCHDLMLEPGLYRIVSDKLFEMHHRKVALDQLEPLSPEDYAKAKIPTASLLSFNSVSASHLPVLHW
jgi:hypothetical protein